MDDQFYLYQHVSENQHEHQLVFIKEFTGEHKVYWCRECGLIMEFFSMMTAHMIPEWSKERLSENDRKEIGKYKFVQEKPHKTENRLGRGLKDIKPSYPTKLAKLLGMK